MEDFKYKSNHKNVLCTNEYKTKTEYYTYMKYLESGIADIIKNTDLNENYYILGDLKLIAIAKNYDDATLIAEALASHSPYYKQVNVMSKEGLHCHFLSCDMNNDKRNHIKE